MALERVCVIGAGTIGSLFAAHLAQVAEVSVLTRRREHTDALNRDGLRVSGKSELTARVRAATDIAELAEMDLVIVAVKATQLEEVATAIAGHFPGAVLVTTQNGLGAEELLSKAGSWRIVSAVTFMSGTRHDDAHVEYELDTATWLGPYGPTRTPLSVVEAVRDLIVESGLKAEAFPDLRSARWSKLIFNAAVNGVAALTELPHMQAFADEQESTDLGHVVRALMDEAKVVATAAGVELFEDPWEMNVNAVRSGESRAGAGAYAHPTSMLEDVLAHRPTEIDFITGAIVSEADSLGVEAPLNAAVWGLIKGKQASW